MSHFDFSLYTVCDVTNLDTFSGIEIFFFFFVALSVPAIKGPGLYS